MCKLSQTKVYCDSSIITENNEEIGNIGIEISSYKQNSLYYRISNIKLKRSSANELEQLSIYLAIVLSQKINTKHLFVFNDNITAVRNCILELKKLEDSFPSLQSLQIGWIPNTELELFTVDFLSRESHKKTLSYPPEILNKLGNLTYIDIKLPDTYPALDNDSFLNYVKNEGFLLKLFFGLFENFDENCKLSLIKEHLYPKKPAISHIQKNKDIYCVSLTSKNFFNIDFSGLSSITDISIDSYKYLKSKISTLQEQKSIELSIAEQTLIEEKTSSFKEEIISKNVSIEEIKNTTISNTDNVDIYEEQKNKWEPIGLTKSKKEELITKNPFLNHKVNERDNLFIFKLEQDNSYSLLFNIGDKPRKYSQINFTFVGFKSFFNSQGYGKFKEKDLKLIFNLLNKSENKKITFKELSNFIYFLLMLDYKSTDKKKVLFLLNYLKVFGTNKFVVLYSLFTQKHSKMINDELNKSQIKISGQILHNFLVRYPKEDFSLNKQTFINYYLNSLF